MKRITIIALLAAAVFNADGNAKSLQLTCDHNAVTLEQTKITVNGYAFPVSGGTYQTPAGDILQFAGTDVNHQVAIAVTPTFSYALIGWSDTPLECTVINSTDW